LIFVGLATFLEKMEHLKAKQKIPILPLFHVGRCSGIFRGGMLEKEKQRKFEQNE
jgi:hypothetical protein